MTADKFHVKFVLNRSGEPTRFQEAVVDVLSSVKRVKEEVFSEQIREGLLIRFIFLGKELKDDEKFSDYLKHSVRAASAGVCTTAGSVESTPSVYTVHVVLSNVINRIGSGGVGGSDTNNAADTRSNRVGGDVSVGLLGLTVSIILIICWYNHLTMPEDSTQLSSLLLILFTLMFCFAFWGFFVQCLRGMYLWACRCMRSSNPIMGVRMEPMPAD